MYDDHTDPTIIMLQLITHAPNDISSILLQLKCLFMQQSIDHKTHKHAYVADKQYFASMYFHM